MNKGQKVLVAVAAVVVALCVAVAIWAAVEDNSTEGVTAVIDNRVTNGPELMREDDAPACLTETPRNFCPEEEVVVTDLWSGDQVSLLCQTTSERTTNGNDSDVADDTNPDLYTSDPGLWYWARFEGEEGYISEVWIESDKRGGADRPRCK
jgi:hypothetical protein